MHSGWWSISSGGETCESITLTTCTWCATAHLRVLLWANTAAIIGLLSNSWGDDCPFTRIISSLTWEATAQCWKNIIKDRKDTFDKSWMTVSIYGKSHTINLKVFKFTYIPTISVTSTNSRLFQHYLAKIHHQYISFSIKKLQKWKLDCS